MERPLFRYTVAQLEGIFANARDDEKTLVLLEAELKNRQVPRAVELHDLVRKALKALSSAEATGASPEQTSLELEVPKLFAAKPSPAPVAPSTVTAARSTSPREPLEIPRLGGAPARPRVVDQVPGASLTLDAAYKLLKATPNTSWEEVERIRQQLVLQAHPDKLATLSPEARGQAKGAAKEVNAAYMLLLAARQA
jgi:DnaJ-domain-containing protein 1